MNDKELAKGIKKGSVSAYRELFLRYYSIIYHFILRYVKNHDEASDVAQDIFMKVWINRQRLDPEKISNPTYIPLRRMKR